MQIEHALPEGWQPDAPAVALTIGSFDGIHHGHRALISRTAQAAREMRGHAVVVTFDPHPRCVLRPDECPTRLTTLEQRFALLRSLGVDAVVVQRFDLDVSHWSPESFCDRLLAAYPMRRLVVGEGFALGHKRRGDIPFLERFFAEREVEVDVVAPVVDGDERVSSTRIRAAVESGDVSTAARLLERPHVLSGEVEHGNRMGHKLGFPTANIAVPRNFCVPAAGIYTSWLRVRGRWHVAATSVGYRPTFGGDRLTVEAHILDFDDDIYGEVVDCAFVERLRDEVAYEGPEQLIEQIGRDVAETRARLAGTVAPAGL